MIIVAEGQKHAEFDAIGTAFFNLQLLLVALSNSRFITIGANLNFRHLTPTNLQLDKFTRGAHLQPFPPRGPYVYAHNFIRFFPADSKTQSIQT